ncbi:MAG: glycosyltransferase family 2 protein [bacterium]
MPGSEEEITEHWTSFDPPVVSVVCITYNHEPYIHDAIEGFLIQETDFPFEVIIHDDASTDNTAAIIREYAERYPKIIRPIYQTENQYSLGRRGREVVNALCRGRYIALCEGDDFWVDPKKLQTQVDFLERNPDYVMSFHGAFIIDDEGNSLKESKIPDVKKRDLTQQELLHVRWTPLTLSWVHRNILDLPIPELGMALNGDAFLTSVLGQFGKGKYHRDILPAAYRIHGGGLWSQLRTDRQVRERVVTYLCLYRYYTRLGKWETAQVFWTRATKTYLNSLKSLQLVAVLWNRTLRRISRARGLLLKWIGLGRGTRRPQPGVEE